MRGLALAGLIALLTSASACSSMQRVEAPPEEVQRMVAAGELFGPGEKVRLATVTGAKHEIRVSEIDAERGVVVGDRYDIPIADIAAVETSRLSVGRTALLAGAGIGIYALILIAIAPAIILGGG